MLSEVSVVSVLSVAPYTIQIVDGIQIADQLIYLFIGIKIGRICFFDPLYMMIEDLVPAFDKAKGSHLTDRELCEVLVRHAPELIALIAETSFRVFNA